MESPFKLAHTRVFVGRTPTGETREIKTSVGPAQQRWIFEPQKAIFFEGQIGDAAYLIEKGRAAVVKKGAKEGEYVPVAKIGPGDLFGELALIDGKPRTASVIAIDRVETLVLEAVDFERQLASLDPGTSGAISTMIEFVRKMPPRDAWPGGVMPEIGMDRARIFEVLAMISKSEPSKHSQGAFVDALCRRLAAYTQARLPDVRHDVISPAPPR